MIRMLREIALFFICILLTGCFTDVVDDIKIQKINLNTIEELAKNINKNPYKKIRTETSFPIVAWLGVPPAHTTFERFLEMKNAGININYSIYPDAESLQKALDIAQLLDMKVMIYCPELITDTEYIVNRFKDHPANGGYFLQDEPYSYEFGKLKELEQRISYFDDKNYCYINLFPNALTELNSPVDYTDYINSFLNQIPVKILSFDHYPIMYGGINSLWYQNLEIIKNESRSAKIPFWAFALTVAHGPYPPADLNHLRLQVYSNLAYGAKGIQYFTYWTNNSKKWEFYNAPIEKDGSKTPVYHYMKQMNDEIRNYSTIFSNCNTINVSHFGDVPLGTSVFDRVPNFIEKIEIKNGNALLVEMSDAINSYFMVQNTMLDKEIGLTITADSLTNIILKDGYIIPASLIKDSFKLTPGDMVMFMR